MKYEAIEKYNKQPEDPGRGKHLWVMIAMFHVADPATASGDTIHMDMENLITVDGIGCFKCEKIWEPGLEQRWCNGSVHL